MQNANAQFSRIEKAIASLNQMPERYRVYDRKSWSDLLGLRLFLFAQFIVLYLSQPRNFTLGRRLQDKKRHDVDRLMVSVMSFIVYGGVSGEARRQQGSDLFHYSFEKSFIAVYHIIYNVSVADCLEVLPCTVILDSSMSRSCMEDIEPFVSATKSRSFVELYTIWSHK